MTRDETLAHWQRFETIREAAFNTALESGVPIIEARHLAHKAITEAWNAWADQLLAQKKALEEAAKWQAIVVSDFEDDDRQLLKGENEPTRHWLTLAELDFRDLNFVSQYKYQRTDPKIERFERHPFQDRLLILTVALNDSIINFSGFKFPSNVRFNRTVFSCPVEFSETEWHGPAHFFGCEFKSHAALRDSRFLDFAWFSLCLFGSFSNFIRTEFLGSRGVLFNLTVFEFTTRFDKVLFGGVANFLYCEFEYYTSFQDAEFRQEPHFSAISAKRHFNLYGAKFRTKAPNFSQATFTEAPRLDVIYFDQIVEPGGFWRSLIRHSASADAVIGKYRDLRRLAVQGQDHASEARFLKGEIRARRNSRDKLWHGAWWLGAFYDGISDVGQSLSRPLALWALSVFGFASFYLIQSGLPFLQQTSCVATGSDPRLQALLISVKNAFVAFSTSRDPRIVAAYECVFGSTGGRLTVPLPVTLAEMLAQVPLSATLIFLFLLAVRNKFRIK